MLLQRLWGLRDIIGPTAVAKSLRDSLPSTRVTIDFAVALGPETAAFQKAERIFNARIEIWNELLDSIYVDIAIGV